jgi:hypothetical protein
MISIYIVIDEGVKNLRDPRYTELVGRGIKLFVCAYGCQQHGVSTDAARFPHFSLRPGRAVEYCERLRPVSGFYMTTIV